MPTLQDLLRQRALLQQMQEINEAMIRSCCEGSDLPAEYVQQISRRPVEEIHSLCESPSFFRGKQVMAIIFANNTRIEVPTWRALVETVLADCNSDAERHVKLMNMRGHIPGRRRQLLSHTAEGMRSALEIDENLYLETHYDTETLLKIMLNRILDPIGYDYSGIRVVLRGA